jgi:hypothetical protein
MKHKRLVLSGMLLLGLGLCEVQAQTMYVKEKGGTATPYALSNISKLTFSGGNLVVHPSGENSLAYALTNLRYLNFDETVTSLVTNKQSESVSLLVYPNPVVDVLNIQFESSATSQVKVEILSLDGKVMHSQLFKAQTGISQKQIYVTAKGFYVCRINNGSTITSTKFLKK